MPVLRRLTWIAIPLIVVLELAGRYADRRTIELQHTIKGFLRRELTVDGLHVSAGPGFAVNKGDSGTVLVNRVVIGADSVPSLDLTTLMFFLPSGGDADRVFTDWQRRCGARPGMCRAESIGRPEGSMTCLEISTRVTKVKGDFHVLCRRPDGPFQARYSGSADAYPPFRAIIERTLLDGSESIEIDSAHKNHERWER